MTKKICSILLIAVTTIESLAVLLMPSVGQAAVGSAVGSFTSCYAGAVAPAIENGLGQAAQAAILSPTVQNKINNAIGSHLNDFKSIFSGKIGGAKGEIGAIAGGFLSGIASFVPFGSFFSGLLGIGGPQQVVDQNSEKILTAIYDYLASTQVRDKIISRCTAKTVEDQIIGNTLDIARTMGRDGGPAFVTNWNNFETQSQYRGENIFRAELSTAQLCNYFSNDVKQSYGVDPNKKINIPSTVNSRTNSLQPFSLQVHCTLPNNFNMNNYQQNFADNGGWDTYDKMLDPQNNPYGVGFLSQSEIDSQRNLQQTADNTQAIANNGYIGISGQGKGDSCLVQGVNGECLYYKNIKTPGSNLSGAVNATTNAEFGWINNTQDLGGLVANAAGVMINRLLSFSNPNEGDYKDANDTSIPDSPYIGPTDAQGLYNGSTPMTTGFPTGPTPDEQSVVASARSKYGTHMNAAQIVELLKSVATTLNTNNVAGGPFGVLVKDSGSNCNGYSCDIICTGQGNAQMQWDVLGSGDPDVGTQNPQWDGPMMVPNIAVRECEIQGGSPSTSTSANSPSGSSNNSSTSGTSTSSGGTSSSGNDSSPNQF